MEYILILYYILFWCIKVSKSSHFILKEGVMQKPEINTSKYVYAVEHSTPTESGITQIYSNGNARTESLTSEIMQDICNITAVGDTSAQRKKRYIHYLPNFPTTTEIADTNDFSILSDAFLNCTHTTVEAECYQMLPNRSVYVPLYSMFFDRENYVINRGLLFVCPDFFDLFEEKFSSNIGTISTVGISISSVCIILHMIMFFLVEKLRNLPGYCLFSLCISLLITYMTSFIQLKISDQADCKVIGLLMMYSLLSSFFWMNVISFDVWHAIRLATNKLRLTANRSMLVRFTFYSCYAWAMPILVIILAVIADHFSEDEEYRLIFRLATCWFQYRTALLLYFALPVFILIVMNIVFFVTSFLMITRSRSNSGSQDAHSLRSRLFMSLRLGSVMGLMWVFGLIATATQREWIYYLHSLCTALQGVFIFFSFTLNKKTQRACKKVMKSKKISVMSALSQQTKY